VEAFDAGVLRSELLTGGFQRPLERQGFRFGLGGQVNYDSNLYLDEFNEKADFSFVVSPSVEYRSAPAGVPGLVTFRYTPFIRLYFEETDLNTVDHSANAAVSFAGARGNFEVSADYGRFSNADQNLGGRRETETFSVRATAAYQLASRTSLEGSFSGRTSTDTDLNRVNAAPGRGNDDESLQLQLAAYWQATAKTRFGPSVRYSKSSSDSIGDRDSLAFLVVADYVPRDELSFYASAGVERTSSDNPVRNPGFSAFDRDSTDFTGSFGFSYRPDERIVLGADLSYQAIPAGSSRVSRSGGGDQSLTGGITLSYLPNDDWSFQFGFNADAYPSADTTNYSIGDQSFIATVTRRLGEGSLALSGSLTFSDYESVGNATTPREDEDRYSVSLRYQQPVFANRGLFHSSVQWSDNSGNRDWQRFQATVGVDFEF
jgi:hypothetical protein